MNEERRRAVLDRRRKQTEHGDTALAFLLGERLERILHNTECIMADIQSLQNKVDELQAAVDADQAADAQVVADLQAEVDRLKGELANGATPEQIQAIVDRLETIKNDVAGTNA